MSLRIFDFSDGFTSSTNPANEGVTAARFETFANDAAYVADKGSAAADGDAYYNTTDDKVRVYANGSWVEVASFEP